MKKLFQVVGTWLLASILAVAVVSVTPATPASAVDPSPSPSNPSESPSVTPTPTDSATPTPTDTGTPSSTPTATPSPTSTAPCTAEAALKAKTLGKLYAYAIDTATGKVLLDSRGTELTPSASVMKVLTMASVVTNLPADYTAKTYVYKHPTESSTIILKGGGDHTLSRFTGTSFTTYSKAPRIAELVAQIKAVWPAGKKIKKIVLDASFFDGPNWNSNWNASSRLTGDVSKITALQLDGDRANADLTSRAYSGRRSNDPVGRAGAYFKQALGSIASKAQIRIGKTPATATQIAVVSSRKLPVLMKHALHVSDNTETETLAFHAVKAAGLKPNWSSVSSLSKQTLANLGVDLTGITLKDASGLSSKNRVTAKALASLMSAIATSDGALGTLDELLPVAGKSGTLSSRFTGKNAVARLNVFAKTGYIPGLYSLAGIVNAQDGSKIAFAIFARGGVEGYKVTYTAKPAIDTLVTRLYRCGSALTK